MTEDTLSPEEQIALLKLARQGLEFGVRGEPLPQLAPDEIPVRLLEPGATFVTLTKGGQLRGCIGTLDPYRSLADDVREHAMAAALKDYRFPQVQSAELDEINIEVSRLTSPHPIEYDGPDDLLAKIQPGVDGLVIRDGPRRATFLPQVWEKLPDPVDFLNQLCRKMGGQPDLWRIRPLEIEVYWVEKYYE
ncbi:MAG: AmmeMemoRadiSam system protein A [Anaerolineales bacterium]|nr:AmmeMemoRadiSam system protein A [Anaerolineales bacterium]